MTAEENPSNRRGLVRPTKGHSRQKQLAAVLGEGCGAIYIVGKHSPLDMIDGAHVYEAEDACAEWLRSIRPGDTAYVLTIGRVGSKRSEIIAALDMIDEVGAVLVEISTGRRSDRAKDSRQMMYDAMVELSHRHSYSSETGKAARAKQLANAVPRDRLSVSDARTIWFDVERYPTRDHVKDHARGWSDRMLYYEFGPRHKGDPARGGRPRADLPPHKWGKPKPGEYVYFLSDGDAVKIGYTSNGETNNRTKSLQTAHHKKLALIAKVPGTMADEKYLHRRYVRHRISGEWFRIEGDLAVYLKSLKKQKT